MTGSRVRSIVAVVLGVALVGIPSSLEAQATSPAVGLFL